MIAFDGLSLAGKSTMVQMLYLRSTDAVVIRENEFDPIRPATSRLNKLLKQHSLPGSLAQLREDSSNIFVLNAVREAEHYVAKMRFSGWGQQSRKQAALAYFFTKGRTLTDSVVREQEKDVILDRWWVSGMAYQVQPGPGMAHRLGLSDQVLEGVEPGDTPYTWQDICDLNQCMDVSVPDMQYILTCPVEDIPARRAYRQKQGTGTSGQMSGGREELIYHTLGEIHGWLREEGLHSHWLENTGTPTESLDEQIRQSIPAYLAVEENLRETLERGDYDFGLAPEPLTYRQAEEFFLDAENKRSIYERQCLGRVADEDRKSV